MGHDTSPMTTNSRLTHKLLTPNHTPPSLTEDLILYEIFPRLPVKTIHRFCCVSTSCRHLPSDQQFLAAVRRLARRYLLSLSCQFRPYSLSLFQTNPLRGPAVFARGLGDCIWDKNYGYKFHVTYVQAINGFICRGYQDCLVIVSNPATNETFEIRRPPEPHGRGFFYFCHDPDTDRYKVLRTDSSGTRTTYSVFTLGDKTAWRHFPQLPPELYQLGKSKSVCIGGILYLNNFCNGRHEGVICAFSVKSDSFHAVRYPKGLARSRYDDCHLVGVKGALVVIEAEYSNTRCDITLWIKGSGSDDDDESWTVRRIKHVVRCETLFNVSLNYSFSTNVDGEILIGSTRLRPDYGCSVFVYNMESGKWRKVEILGMLDFGSHVRVEEYVESPQILQTSDSACVVRSQKSRSKRVKY